MDSIKQKVLNFLEENKPITQRRKKMDVASIEINVLAQFERVNAYQAAGGYRAFYQVIRELEREGWIEALRNTKSNGRYPSLPTDWWILPMTKEPKWDELQILRISDRLRVDDYRKFLELQTDEEWQRVDAVYRFLAAAKEREWATREERSLELFGDEKWLARHGGPFLRRIGITLDDLKAKVYGEPFVYWTRPGIELSHVRHVLIVENQSIFHTCKRVLEIHGTLNRTRPDMLIYGEGKKIESSLFFLEDIIQGNDLILTYAGDIDPEGWGIYVRLRQRYPQFKISLAIPMYELMLEYADNIRVSAKEQYANVEYLNAILEELSAQSSPSFCQKIEAYWQQARRIPQEVLTFERLTSGIHQI